MEELELTFLAKYLPQDLRSFPSKEITDIYIPAPAQHPVLRIRKSGTACEITKKQPIKPGDASHQLETTIPLTAEEFSALDRLEGKRVSKIRYYYKQSGTTFEIDIFQGALQGLVLVDVEFETAEEKSAFTAPVFCLANVTQETFLAGGMLCGKRYGDIESRLANYKYQRIFV